MRRLDHAMIFLLIWLGMAIMAGVKAVLDSFRGLREASRRRRTHGPDLRIHRRVAEIGSDALDIGESGWIEAGDVAREIEMLRGPAADVRQPGPERAVDDVLAIPQRSFPVPCGAVSQERRPPVGVIRRSSSETAASGDSGTFRNVSDGD